MEDTRPLAVNRYRDTRAGALRPGDVGRTVRLAGWIAAKRDHGGLLFVDLRDAGGTAEAGVVQLVTHPDFESFDTLSGLRVESVISVVGTVVARSEETVNPRLATGGVEVSVESLEVLSTADVLPFQVEGDKEAGEEARLRYRYLDMRRGPVVERLAKRARFAQLVRTHMAERGFLEVQTPILTASSPEGARDFLVPSRLYPGEFYALPQAPQQFKQLLMVGGVDRYFQIAPCFRDEASRADRSPGEFYQIDLEMAFATQEDVFEEVELLMSRVVHELSSKTTSTPFPHLAYADAVDRYGTDKPDLRFGLEIADVTGELGGRTELPMFTDAPAKGHRIRALLAPQGAGRSRKWFDGFADAAKRLGVIGSWLQLDPDGAKGPLSRKLTEAELATLAESVGAQPGDAVLTTVGPRVAASSALGGVRSELGRELGLADPQALAFAWVVDFPMFERNAESGAWEFSHNPFSMPQGGLDALRDKDPGDILAYQYDLVCNGLELSSGAVRNHRPDIMEAAFAIAGYDAERIRTSFPALWNAFHYGPPPHAGIAPGFDRILMMLEDQANLREVIAFPLNQTARDLLMGAPSPVDDGQLNELHLRVVPPPKPT
ncbi:aspartate--tRNA ligase [Acidiferrimicrobium sp. IK]|uniref:aspartate--tRNA ligase n=1 Tax=Acidiferrimicrobium sp. IK TaxID=2871700 RepID=UPI0021CB6864|nr:aspartate--tRNA ligase [Acidiferrimicrobium sp. IK]MCU4184560.1 aspartate--tRNA ligase [Acidiferrimicrobium sp. IK]